jgi:hypothetical protein
MNPTYLKRQQLSILFLLLLVTGICLTIAGVIHRERARTHFNARAAMVALSESVRDFNEPYYLTEQRIERALKARDLDRFQPPVVLLALGIGSVSMSVLFFVGMAIMVATRDDKRSD